MQQQWVGFLAPKGAQGVTMSVCPCVRHKQKRAIRALNSESYSHLCYICGLFSASLCPPCNCPSVIKYKNVNGRTDYTCSYFTKTYCHTPCCSSPVVTDGHITLAHITLPHPLLLLPPGNGRTYYTSPYYIATPPAAPPPW